MPHQHTMPTIPASRYPERWAKVQEMMEARKLDYLVAYADDRATFGPPVPAGWSVLSVGDPCSLWDLGSRDPLWPGRRNLQGWDVEGLSVLAPTRRQTDHLCEEGVTGSSQSTGNGARWAGSWIARGFPGR